MSFTLWKWDWNEHRPFKNKLLPFLILGSFRIMCRAEGATHGQEKHKLWQTLQPFNLSFICSEQQYLPYFSPDCIDQTVDVKMVMIICYYVGFLSFKKNAIFGLDRFLIIKLFFYHDTSSSFLKISRNWIPHHKTP